MSYSTGTALLEALLETGVDYVFANLGSDYTSIVEAYAAKKGLKLSPGPAYGTPPTSVPGLDPRHPAGSVGVQGRFTVPAGPAPINSTRSTP